MRTSVPLNGISALVNGELEDPGSFLGPHSVAVDGRKAISVRAYCPDSRRVWLDSGHGLRRPMRRIHPSGIYEATCYMNEEAKTQYQIQVMDAEGKMSQSHDPYAFQSYFSDDDLYLIGEGNHRRLYERLGAQLRTVDGVSGVNFSVWAPNASGVSLVGDFNNWDGRRHGLCKRIPSGIWELFVPHMGAGEKYKFRIRTQHGEVLEKSDPFAFASETPPLTASIVTDMNAYEWQDAEWMAQRRDWDFQSQPMSVYEVHLGSWRRDPERNNGWKNYRELAHELVKYCRELGYTHIELLPVSEHPFTGSWGYQTLGHYAATSRYGTPDDFKYFVDYFHQNGIGVILDWVPAHFPRDGHGLRRFDGSALYEHEDPRLGEHPDWGTMIFNYDRHEVRNYLVANALFWLDKYHIDGLRVDAVASMLYLDYSREEGEWIPNQYGGRENLGAIEVLKQFNEVTHSEFPGVLTIAEESTAWPGVSRPTYDGGLGFSIKWNMGWMNDTLRYMRRDPIHRCHHQGDLTFSLIYAFTENFALPFSHDEVVHGKGALLDQMPGDLWQKFANLRLLYSYMWTHPGKKLLFMGSEIAQWKEWDCNEEIDWALLEFSTHKGVQRLVSDLNQLYRSETALHQNDFCGNGFEWIDCHNSSESTLSFIRRGQDPNDMLIVCLNMTPVVRHEFRIGVPQPGWYSEVFNSDSQHYDGSNVGNHPGREAEPINWNGHEHSLSIALPPLAAVVFKLQ